MADGRIENFFMISADDNFSIRKYAPASEGGEMISAKISETAAISGCAALTLENGAELEVLNAADLTVKNGSSIIINTDADSSTSFKVNSDGRLAFENGAILEINVVSDMSARDTLQIVIMDFDDGARIAGLDALIKDETIQLSVNGSKWLGEWDYALENNQMLITVAVPEPLFARRPLARFPSCLQCAAECGNPYNKGVTAGFRARRCVTWKRKQSFWGEMPRKNWKYFSPRE